MKDKDSKKNTILLVEDDPLLIKMYKMKFIHDGYDVLVAKDGQTGLKMATEENIDIILLDIMIPRLSGTDMLAALRKTRKGKKVPVIIATNLSDEDEKQKALKLGIDDYLLKVNLSPSDLVTKIKKGIKN